MDIIKRILFFILFLTFIHAISLYAEEVSFTQEDRERLIRLEVTLQEFKEANDKRFEELREDMNKRFEQMMSFLWIITGIFTTLTVGVIGFAFWDRRTVIQKAKKDTIEVIEKEGRLRDLIHALRELAKTDPKVETVLRNFHLL